MVKTHTSPHGQMLAYLQGVLSEPVQSGSSLSNTV